MAIHKNIIWRPDIEAEKDGKMFANIHLLVGYNQSMITDYQKMAEELRKTFPDITDAEIGCHSVTKSNYCNNFSLITVNKIIPRGEYPEWRQFEGSAKVEYLWT